MLLCELILIRPLSDVESQSFRAPAPSCLVAPRHQRYMSSVIVTDGASSHSVLARPATVFRPDKVLITLGGISIVVIATAVVSPLFKGRPLVMGLLHCVFIPPGSLPLRGGVTCFTALVSCRHVCGSGHHPS